MKDRRAFRDEIVPIDGVLNSLADDKTVSPGGWLVYRALAWLAAQGDPFDQRDAADHLGFTPAEFIREGSDLAGSGWLKSTLTPGNVELHYTLHNRPIR